MNQTKKDFRILAIIPSTKTLALLFLKDRKHIVECAVNTLKRDRSARSLKTLEWVISHYQPGVLVLKDASTKGSRRSSRIRKICQQIIEMTATRKVSVKLYSRAQMIKTFTPDGEGTKHVLAEISPNNSQSNWRPNCRRERKAWESEDSRINIFVSVALVLVFRLKRVKKTA